MVAAQLLAKILPGYILEMSELYRYKGTVVVHLIVS